jgi:hypothetical protein
MIHMGLNIVTTPPSSWTELKYVRDYDTAVELLRQKIWLMTRKTITLTVSHAKGASWYLTKLISLSLPKLTNNAAVLCKIIDLSIDKNKNKVSVKLLILDDIVTAFNRDVWQDSDDATDTKQDANDATDTKQDDE